MYDIDHEEGTINVEPQHVDAVCLGIGPARQRNEEYSTQPNDRQSASNATPVFTLICYSPDEMHAAMLENEIVADLSGHKFLYNRLSRCAEACRSSFILPSRRRLVSSPSYVCVKICHAGMCHYRVDLLRQLVLNTRHDDDCL